MQLKPDSIPLPRRSTTSSLSPEAGHEALKAGSELIGIKQPEHATERVMARRPMLQFEKLAQKALLGPAKDVHIHRSLATT